MKDIYRSEGYLLNVTAKLMKRDLDARLSEFDLTTSQGFLLKTLSQKNVMSQVEIAKCLNADRATCGTIIDRMTAKDLLIKQPNERDRRAYNISLSPKGERMAKEMSDKADECNNTALAGFTEGERAQMRDMLHRVMQNLEGER